MTKHEKISFNKNKFIGSINYINNNKKEFFNKTKDYFSKNDISENTFNRFLELLKITNVYIDDEGNICNKFEDLLNGLIHLNILNDSQKKSLNSIMSDANTIQKLKQQINFNIDEIASIKYCNYLLNIVRLKNDDLEYIFNYIEQTIIPLISKSLRKLLLNNHNFNIDELNEEIDLKYKFNLKTIENYYVLVQLWKYADAKLQLNENNKLVIDGTNDINLSFVISNCLLHRCRNKKCSLQVDDYLDGIASCYFIPASDYKKLGQTQINDVPINEWIEFLIEFKKYFMRHNNFDEYFKFFKLEKEDLNQIFKFFKLEKEDLNQIFKDANITETNGYKIVNQLLFTTVYNTSCLLDSPIIYTGVQNTKNDLNNIDIDKLYFYGPALIKLDPVYVISERLRDYIENNRGRNFEDIIPSFIKNKRKILSKEERKDNKKQNYEIDGLIEDENNQDIIYECKTFNLPTDIKGYRIHVDKLKSKKYIDKAIRNIDHYVNLPRIKKEYCNIDQSIKLFISNLVFPSNYIDNSDFLFIDYLSLKQYFNKSHCEYKELKENNISFNENLKQKYKEQFNLESEIKSVEEPLFIIKNYLLINNEENKE